MTTLPHASALDDTSDTEWENLPAPSTPVAKMNISTGKGSNDELASLKGNGQIRTGSKASPRHAAVTAASQRTDARAAQPSSVISPAETQNPNSSVSIGGSTAKSSSSNNAATDGRKPGPTERPAYEYRPAQPYRPTYVDPYRQYRLPHTVSEPEAPPRVTPASAVGVNDYASHLQLYPAKSNYWKAPTDSKTFQGQPVPYIPRLPETPSKYGRSKYSHYEAPSSGSLMSESTEQELHDLLSSIAAEDNTDDAAQQPSQLTIKLMPHQLKGVTWMTERESGKYKGGILADDMGLGKTVQTISTILANPSDNEKCKSTLIVAPLALIKQWEQEIATKTKKGSLSVLLYHGSSRSKDLKKITSHDVVITTYQVVAAECPKAPKKTLDDDDEEVKIPAKKAGPLFQIDWYRIVLDEAQSIKNKSTKSAIGCCTLHAERRFCLSGTPLQNNVDELYSLLKFLRFKPFDEYSVFKSQIAEPLARGRSKLAMDRLRIVLQAIMLRRTKKTVIDGKPLLNLPERNVELQTIQFSPEEMAYYTELETKMRNKLRDYRRAGYERNYTNILVLLLRLRQACNHRHLVGQVPDKEGEIAPEKGAAEEEDIDEMMAMFKSMGVDADKRQCTICFASLEGLSSEQKQCNDCKAKFAKSDRGNATNPFGDWVSSAKIDTMVKILARIHKEDPGSKVIIFSQFTSMLDLVEIPLKRSGYKFCRYDGSMKNPDRERSIDMIRNKPEVTIMLISLKCGSLGLNLTAANRVIMLDMWWNPALEDQAIDRVHRIGQTKPVEVIRLAVEGTVEDRINALQSKKVTWNPHPKPIPRGLNRVGLETVE
ncbi:hypothetical protein HDU85_003178 [Gaertneriomyces sp. JEL0708]|nr:hypothetical protein HDU85_003178 [Gaertneriomyces sp. JEL0708]